jgi:hypothetical protein
MLPGDPIYSERTLTHRAKAIITRPKEEWPVIEAEPRTTRELFTGYAMILAAIAPLCQLIGGQLFGWGAMGISFRPSLVGALVQAVVSYGLSLVGLFVLALIVNALAPTFDSVASKNNAMKLAIYASTAAWLAGIVFLIPSLGFLAVVGLYSLYLLFTGLPVLMKTPEPKVVPYFIAILVAGLLLFLVVGAIVGAVTAAFVNLGGGYEDKVEGEIRVPGVGKIDLGKLNDASAKMEAAANKMEDAAKTGESAAIPAATLQALLPEQIGRFARTEVESSSMAAGSHASARYEAGEDNIRVEVTDMAIAGAFAGLGAALNVQSNKETATGYERTQTVDGRIVSEEWDKESRDGKYMTTIANRFMVEARGRVASVDELKAAVDAIGPDKLAALAGK